MFNSPRPGQRYVATPNNGFGGSFVDDNPLAASGYDGLDPWSAAPSPSPPPIPAAPSVFSAVIADATVPAIYNTAFSVVDPTNLGETSVNALSRVLSTSSLPASTVDRIVSLISSRPRVSKLEFFVGLALVALAQSGKDVSIEQVAALSSQNMLPEPRLDLDSFPPSLSTLGQNNGPPVRPPPPAYTSDDPWNTARFSTSGPSGSGLDGNRGNLNGTTSSIAGSGMPRNWWKKQEKATVTMLGHQGFILNRYMVYELTTDRGGPVPRRYSEFVYLWDCLTRRYPFRLFPVLPPKRVGPDDYFLEQRRRGLARAISFVINHPVIKEDGVLAVFLTEPSFETWRKHTPVSLEEESVSKRVDRIEEMSIPSDLEEKLATVRSKINPLIEQWQRICMLAERVIKRREAAAVWFPPAYRPFYFPTHFPFAFTLSPPSTTTSPAHSVLSDSLAPHPDIRTLSSTEQGDLTRLTNTLRTVIEASEHPWRGDDCELSNGVRQGLSSVAQHVQNFSDLSEQRSRMLLDTTLEALKNQRDLYIAMRDLFIRHDRLSFDQVDRLKKRVETNSLRLEAIKTARKDGWQDEADKIVSTIEKDQATIASQLNRRVFIRSCMWNEIRVVLHNRENTLVTLAVQAFAREEQEYAESVANNWVSLVDALESMPVE